MITAVAFDKTGTLTLGRPRVTDVMPWTGVDEREMLSIAAAVERLSEHPLGMAVVQYAESNGFGGLIDEGDISEPAVGAGPRRACQRAGPRHPHWQRRPL